MGIARRVDGHVVKGRLFDILLGLVAGLLIGWGSGALCYDGHLKRVQVFVKANADTARTEVAGALAYAAAQKHRADSIAATRQPVEVASLGDAAAAARYELQALHAHDEHDVNIALRLENQALRRALGAPADSSQPATGLWLALEKAKLETATERRTGDSLKVVIVDLNLRLQTSAAQVAGLSPPPKWLTIGWHVVAAVGLVKVGYDLGRKGR